MMMLVSTISYLDRNTLALLAPTILKEAHLTNEQYGFIISAFSIAYMLANPVWGKILDKVGVRFGMTTAVAVWTLASVAHVFAGGFRGFAAARTVLGFGEGATFPGGLRTVVQTLPARERSRGTAIAYSGGSLGALITPIVITPINKAWGWHGAFWFTGAVGAAWLLGWMFLSRRPELARRPDVRQGVAALKASDPRLWAYLATYALGAFPSAFVLYQSAVYLHAAMGKQQDEIGYVLWIPPLGWEIGYFFWGWVIDRYAESGGSIRSMRKLFGILTLMSLSIAAVPAAAGSFSSTLALFFVAMFSTSGFIIGSMAYATSHFSQQHAGLIAGLGAGSWSAVVALLMPGVGRLFDLHRYPTAFLGAAILPVASFALWNILNGSIPRADHGEG
jgi:ACS family hexuronate transporter-like MFS transporter